MSEFLSNWNQYILSSFRHSLVFNYLQASQIDYTTEEPYSFEAKWLSL